MIKLLHLEDDPDIQEITQMALDMTGRFTLLQCSTGEEALAQAPGFAPDVLLLDVMVPGMSGPVVLSALRDLPGLADIPAIFMTARVQPSEVRALIEHGAIAVVSKPFDPLTLGSEIEMAMSRATETA